MLEFLWSERIDILVTHKPENCENCKSGENNPADYPCGCRTSFLHKVNEPYHRNKNGKQSEQVEKQVGEFPYSWLRIITGKECHAKPVLLERHPKEDHHKENKEQCDQPFTDLLRVKFDHLCFIFLAL